MHIGRVFASLHFDPLGEPSPEELLVTACVTGNQVNHCGHQAGRYAIPFRPRSQVAELHLVLHYIHPRSMAYGLRPCPQSRSRAPGRFSQDLELAPRIDHICIALHRSLPTGGSDPREAKRMSLASRARIPDVHGGNTSTLLSVAQPAGCTDETTGEMSFEVSGNPPWIYRLPSVVFTHTPPSAGRGRAIAVRPCLPTVVAGEGLPGIHCRPMKGTFPASSLLEPILARTRGLTITPIE
jgi:hypothetical protein